MNIKNAEKETGVSSQNIRYYEKEGLITPKRNHLNAYREYGEEELRRIKLIKMFRMLDIPIVQIKRILDETISLKEAMSQQQNILEENAQKLKDAITFCKTMAQSDDTVETLDVDQRLLQMNAKTDIAGYFLKWVDDYKKVVKSEHDRHFTFVPDDAITNRNEFMMALFKYADQNNLNLVITKEGMYPEFTIDGIEYMAERYYTSVNRVPMAVVSCTMKNISDYEPEVKTKRAKYMRAIHLSWPALVFIVAIAYFIFKEEVTTQNMILFCLLAVVAIALVVRNFYLYWNIQN